MRTVKEEKQVGKEGRVEGKERGREEVSREEDL